MRTRHRCHNNDLVQQTTRNIVQLFTPVSTCLISHFAGNNGGMQTNSKAAASAHVAFNARSLAAASTDPPPDSSDGAAVRAALLHAGFPNNTVSRMFKHYSSYRSWDVDTKLHHSLELWLQELGSEELAAQLLRFPHMLRRTPQEMRDLRLWLLSLGIDADRALRENSRLTIYRLQGLQGKVDAFRADNLPGLVLFVLRHPQALMRNPDNVFELYSAVAEMLDVDPASIYRRIRLSAFKHKSADISHYSSRNEKPYVLLSAVLCC